MADMTGQVMALCRNYFEGEAIEGRIVIDFDGRMHLPETLGPARYVAIRGSAMHDGVWQLSGGAFIHLDGSTPEVPGETFYGMVWPLYPPAAFLRICTDVSSFVAAMPSTPIQSESFGDYSYTLASGQNGTQTWQERFSANLLPYRRMFTEVGV